MTFVCYCFHINGIALFVYRKHPERTLLCGSGISEVYFFLIILLLYSFFPDKFFPMPKPSQLQFSLPRKSFILSLFMAGFSFSVKAFLKCHLHLEILADFPHKENPQSVASSLSQMEKWRPCSLATVYLCHAYYDWLTLCIAYWYIPSP